MIGTATALFTPRLECAFERIPIVTAPNKDVSVRPGHERPYESAIHEDLDGTLALDNVAFAALNALGRDSLVRVEVRQESGHVEDAAMDDVCAMIQSATMDDDLDGSIVSSRTYRALE